MDNLSTLVNLLNAKHKEIKFNADIIICGDQGPFMKCSGYHHINYNKGYQISIGEHLENIKFESLKYQNSILRIKINMCNSYLQIEKIKELSY